MSLDTFLIRPSAEPEPLLTPSITPSSSSVPVPTTPNTTSDILTALRSRPSPETVAQCLNLLTNTHPITTSSSTVHSQIARCLLETTLPDHWPFLAQKQRKQVSRCLASAAGLAACVGTLKTLVGDTERKAEIGEVLEVLQMCLARKGCLFGIWQTTAAEKGGVKAGLLWKEVVGLIAGGRVLGMAAEADDVLGRTPGQEGRWIGDGRRFAEWFGGEVAEMCRVVDSDEGWKATAQIMAAGLRLGYTDIIVDTFSRSLVHPTDTTSRLLTLLNHLSLHAKRTYLLSYFSVIATSHLSMLPDASDPSWWTADASTVAAAAGLIQRVMSNDSEMWEILTEWMTSSGGGGVGCEIGIRRALVMVIGLDESRMKQIAVKGMQLFADRIWIRHTPVIRQEALVQTLLLIVAHSRSAAASLSNSNTSSSSLLTTLTRSTDYLNGVSNRLGTASQRARFLGLVVGECFSRFTGNRGIQGLEFGVEEMNTIEAKWWKGLVDVRDDVVGDYKNLYHQAKEKEMRKVKKGGIEEIGQGAKGMKIIEEVEENDDEEVEKESDDEFTPYAKPDSDPEDTADEDATTIDRNKPKPPVYIRTLHTYLINTSSHPHQLLALTHAAPLIRRKSTSSELLSPPTVCTSLSATLMGLTDKFDIPNFPDLQSSALLALAIANPVSVGPWLTRAFFTGDYGLGQRALLLNTIGVAARELAGLSTPKPPANAVVHKQISSPQSGRIAAIWGEKPTTGPHAHLQPLGALQLDTLTTSLSQKLLTPLVASVADAVSGPNALKVRTFSTRMAVSARRPAPAANKLHAVLAPAFFYPLTGLLAHYLGGPCPALGHGMVLGMLAKTIAVLIDAAGSAYAGLQEVCGEVWEVLRGIRAAMPMDARVLEGVLVAYLALLDVWMERGRAGREVLVGVWGKNVVEVGEWARELVDGGGVEEGVRAVAVGVVLRIGEVVEEFRRGLLEGLGVGE